MALIKLKLTEEHLKLIKNFKIKDVDDYTIGVDKINPYGGNFILEDIAYILGVYDKKIPNSENHYNGPVFPEELTRHMLDLHYYIVDNLYNIENLIHQFLGEPIEPGTYKAIDREQFWSKI